MILFNDELTDAQKFIIKKMCVRQLQSLKRIYDGEPRSEQDITMILIENEVTEEEFIDAIKDEALTYEKIKHNPEHVTKIDETQVILFKHLLENLPDKYKRDYPLALNNLWQRIQLIEQFIDINLN